MCHDLTCFRVWRLAMLKGYAFPQETPSPNELFELSSECRSSTPQRKQCRLSQCSMTALNWLTGYVIHSYLNGDQRLTYLRNAVTALLSGTINITGYIDGAASLRWISL